MLNPVSTTGISLNLGAGNRKIEVIEDLKTKIVSKAEELVMDTRITTLNKPVFIVASVLRVTI